MDEKRNPFGGKNPHGMYVPLTDDEMEVLFRLADAGEYKLVVKDLGLTLTGFKVGKYPGPGLYQGESIVTIGDKRISFTFRLDYNAPAVPTPNWYFDMELWALGHLLYQHRMPTESYGKPIQIVAGAFNDFALDIGIDHIDPAIVKEVKAKQVGLTTRQGNMHLDLQGQRLLAQTRAGEKAVREITAAEARKATEKKKKATGR
jgi:hypothetical protein